MTVGPPHSPTTAGKGGRMRGMPRLPSSDSMRLRVTDGGSAAEGARLTVRFSRPDAAPFYTQVTTDSAGSAEMQIEADESSLPDSSILVQASYSGRTATRKFNLRKVEA